MNWGYCNAQSMNPWIQGDKIMEKTLENLKIVASKTNNKSHLDYVDEHFDALVELIEARKKYNKKFKDKLYYNTHNKQIYRFSFISEYDNKLNLQVSTYGKYRGRDDCSGTPTMTLNEGLMLIKSKILIPLKIKDSEFKDLWKELTSIYYKKRETFEIETHNILVQELYKKFKIDW